MPLDSLLDEAHGNPHFRALDHARPRAGPRHPRRRAPPPRRDRGGARRSARQAAAGEFRRARRDPARRGGADPLPRRSRSRRRQSRRRAGRRRPPHRPRARARQRRAAPARARARRDPRRRRRRPRRTRRTGSSSAGAPPMARRPPSAIAAAHLEHARPRPLRRRRDAALWAERLGGMLLPTGSIRLAGAHRVPDLPGFDGRRLVGAGRRRGAAGAAPRRRRGQERRRPLRRAGRQDGASSPRPARTSPRSTSPQSRLKRLARKPSPPRPRGAARSRRHPEWEPAQTFDAVLLDAPCSATGTIRRHPDIAWLKQPKDIATLAALQARMLDRAAALVKPGGLLVYLHLLARAGGRRGAGRALPRAPSRVRASSRSSRPRSPASAISSTPAGALRTLPCHGFGEEPVLHGMDGFFAARFRRR